MPVRKSDSSVVPMKLGNADGGKALPVIALNRETFTTHGGRDNKWKQN